MKKLLVGTLVCWMLGLTACTVGERRDTGMVAGGVVGGLAGSALTGGSTAGTIIGAVGGGYIGRQVTH